MKLKKEVKGGKLFDKVVFKFFEKLINENEEIRLKGASELVTFLTVGGDANEEDKHEKERAYALKRMIRGVGSNTHSSRAGFFTALIGYLDQVKNTEHCPTITEIFRLVKSELSDSDKGEEDSQQTKMELRVGKVSVCGAIIISGLIENASDMELQTVLKTLKKGMHKAATPLAMMYLSELVQKVDSKKFTKIFWPVLEPVVNVPKEQHSMDTIYFLLAASSAHKKSVNQQFFENVFGAPHLIHEKNFEYLANLLWDIKNTLTINHPLYDFLIENLVKQNKVGEFWTHGVDRILQNENSVHKFKDIVALRVLITCMNKMQDYTAVPELLSTALLDLLMKKIRKFSQLSDDVRDMYQETFETLNQCYPKISDENTKLAIFEKLITPPSSILIEKYASNKILQNLLTTMSGKSVKKAANLLKKLILATDTDTDVLNTERIHAAQSLQKLLSNRHLSEDIEWRMTIVKFFLNLGLFYSSDGEKILKNPKNQSTAISMELVPTMKSLFFHCLEHRHAKLADEKSFMLLIVEHLHSVIGTFGSKSLRMQLSDEQLEHWNRMYGVVHAKDKKDKKLNNVFHILMMYMGFHLFNDPELASSSIDELESVMKRVRGKKSTSKMEITQNGKGEEPEWIEVVVDLFLNLMSQNSHLLRKVIAHIFPHLSEEMTLTAFNQILSVINLKDKNNPLTATDKDDGDENDVQMDDEDISSEEDANGNESDDSDEKSESDNDEEDEQFSDDEEDENVTDRMRMAIQTALGGANPETDTESVDLDNMGEEEGRKLDEALAAAFKMYKQSKKTKPTKAEERVETTLTHFRMRVFDLIDAYLKHSPNMIICLELMLYIFEMLPIAIKETKHKQILDRYRQIFNNLVKIKHFNINVKDVSAEQLPQILTDLIEKVAKGSSFPDKNQYILKACQFIVICSQLMERSGTEGRNPSIDQVFAKYLNEFIVERNPALTLNVFQTLLRMNWAGNWCLAKTLAENGLKKEIRTIRKTQTILLLREFVKNRRFMYADPQTAVKTSKIVVTNLCSYMENAHKSKTMSLNEFSELVQFLLELHSLQKLNAEFKSISWKQIGNNLQELRTFNLNSQVMNHYIRLCKALQIEPIKNSQNVHQNGGTGKVNREPENKSDSEGEEEEESEADIETEVRKSNGSVKRQKGNNSLKQKRLKKEERLKLASQGLETVSFVNVE